MDMIAYMPLFDLEHQTFQYWGDGEMPLNFTTTIACESVESQLGLNVADGGDDRWKSSTDFESGAAIAGS